MLGKLRGGGAVHVAAGILLSRIAGLARERVFAHYFGSSEAAGAFRVALRMPNLLQNLFGEGVLSASFIPVYARLLERHDEETAGRLAGALAGLLAAGMAALVLAGVLLAPALVALAAPGFRGEVRELTVTLVRIIFPGTGLLVLSAWCLGVLNSHKRFFVSYVAPVFWNAAMIATMAAFGASRGPYPLAVALAWGTLAGCALQLLVQLPFVLRHERSLRLSLSTTLEPVREVLKNVGPVIASRGAVQLSAYLDVIVASFLGAAAVAALAYAQTLYLLPISLFGMAIAAAELPSMARAMIGVDEEVRARLRERMAAAQRRVAFFVIPSTAAFLFLGRELVAGLFETGRFGPEQTRLVWYILLASTLGLLASAWSRLYASAFYALKDTRTPLRCALARVTVGAALGALLAFPLRARLIAALAALGLPAPALPGAELALGAAGLSLGSAAGGWLEFLLLRKALAEKIGEVGVPAGLLIRFVLCAAAGLVAARAAALVLPWALGVLPEQHAVLAAVWVCGVFGLTYLAAARTLDLY